MNRLLLLAATLVLAGTSVRRVDAEGPAWAEIRSLLDLKERADFANWPGKAGPVRTVVPAVLEATGRSELPVPGLTWVERDGIPRYLLRYDFGWELLIGESGADVQEYLITSYGRCCTSGPIVPERDEPAVAGDISFFGGAAVFRDNILVLFNRGRSGGAYTAAKAAEIDSLLLTGPVYPSAASLKPVIDRLELESNPMPAGSSTPLHIQASNPQGGSFGYLFRYEPLWAGGVSGDRNSLGPFYYQGGQDGGQEELTVVVWNEAGFTSAERMEITVLGPNAPYLVLTPPHLNFRRVAVGEATERSFAITNRGFRDVAVSDISSSSAEFQASSTSFVLPPGAHEEVTVSFNPRSAAGQYAGLTMATDADWQAEVTVWLAANLGVAETPWPMFGHDLRNSSQSTYDGPSAPQLLWRTLTEKAIGTSLAIGVDGTIYVGAGYSNLWALKPTGEVRWKAPSRNLVRCAPAVGSDGTIYAGSDDSWLLALKPTGALMWSYRGEDRAGARAPVIGSDGTIYLVLANGAVHALAPGGALEWKCRVGGPVHTSPAIGSEGTIYGATRSRPTLSGGESPPHHQP